MQSIGILGCGVLGSAIARGFLEWAEVKCYDVARERRTHSLEEAATSDIVFLALPTPALPDGRCNTSYVEETLAECERAGYWRPESCYVLRSTVPCGFTKAQAEKRRFKLPLLHSPEFLTARCAQTDFQCPARNIIGEPLRERSNGQTLLTFGAAMMRLRMLYERRFSGIPIHHMTSDASELVKLACNTFFASKVTLFNLFYELAQKRGLDWEDVRGGILSDGRIAHAHTSVPGPDGKPGGGGTCIVKDSADLFHCCREAGVDAELIREMIERNERTRRPFDEALLKVELPR